MQVHEGDPLTLRHRELGPQGELIHGSIGVSITDGAKIPYNYYEISLIINIETIFWKKLFKAYVDCRNSMWKDHQWSLVCNYK